MIICEIKDLSGRNKNGFYCMKFKIVEKYNKAPIIKEDDTNKKQPLCVRSGKNHGDLPGECKCNKCCDVFENCDIVVDNDSNDESYTE